MWPYQETYFNIVTETKIHAANKLLFVSEKIYKPIINLQPFIVLGSCGTLGYLRSLGFKTFDLDESYDECPVTVPRMARAMDEAVRLAMMSREQLHDWYMAQMPVLLHNQQTLLRMSRGANLVDRIARLIT